MDIEMRSRTIELTGVFCTEVKQRFDVALGRFESRIQRVLVCFADAIDARGSVEKQCKVAVSLRPSLAVFIEDTDADLDTVVHRVAHRTARCVMRALKQQREHDIGSPRLALAATKH